MSSREQAIEAAMKDVGGLRGWCDAEVRDLFGAVLAAVVPQLLGELADCIEAERLTDNTGEPEDVGYNCAISDARGIVRAAAEEWGQ